MDTNSSKTVLQIYNWLWGKMMHATIQWYIDDVSIWSMYSNKSGNDDLLQAHSA